MAETENLEDITRDSVAFFSRILYKLQKGHRMYLVDLTGTDGSFFLRGLCLVPKEKKDDRDYVTKVTLDSLPHLKMKNSIRTQVTAYAKSASMREKRINPATREYVSATLTPDLASDLAKEGHVFYGSNITDKT